MAVEAHLELELSDSLHDAATGLLPRVSHASLSSPSGISKNGSTPRA